MSDLSVGTEKVTIILPYWTRVDLSIADAEKIPFLRDLMNNEKERVVNANSVDKELWRREVEDPSLRSAGGRKDKARSNDR